jgi:hypothetical protein
MEVIDRESVENKLSAALSKLLERDSYLLVNNENERSISHRLGMYLQEEFTQWDVDCEYNRNYEAIKSLELPRTDTSFDDTNAVTVFPDIIVHHRGASDNLLVVEVKKSTNRDSGNWDIQKLRAYKDQLHYEYAVFLRLMTDTEQCGVGELRWF